LNLTPETLSSKELEEQIDFGLEDETLPDNFIELFGESPKLKVLHLLNCSTNQDLDLSHFTHLKKFYIEIHFDASISGRPIKILLPKMAKIKQTMYYTKNITVLVNTERNAHLPGELLRQILFLRFIDLNLYSKVTNFLNSLSELQSLEMIECYNGAIPIRLEFQNFQHLKKIQIENCYYDIAVSLPRKLEEFNVALDNRYDFRATATECIALKKVTLNIREGCSFVFLHPNFACIEHFDPQGSIMLSCNLEEKKEDWTANFKEPTAGEWIKTYQEGHENPSRVSCSCKCSNLIRPHTEGLMNNLLEDIRNQES